MRYYQRFPVNDPRDDADWYCVLCLPDGPGFMGGQDWEDGCQFHGRSGWVHPRPASLLDVRRFRRQSGPDKQETTGGGTPMVSTDAPSLAGDERGRFTECA